MTICDYCQFEIPSDKVGKYVLSNLEQSPPRRVFCSSNHKKKWIFRAQQERSGVLVMWRIAIHGDKYYFLKTKRSIKGGFTPESRFSDQINDPKFLELMVIGGVRTLRVAKT